MNSISKKKIKNFNNVYKNNSSNLNEIQNNVNENTSFFNFLRKPLNVCYIGAGYVGGTSSAVMAYKCPEDQVTVTVCDIDAEKINAWNSNNVKYILICISNIIYKLNINIQLYPILKASNL